MKTVAIVQRVLPHYRHAFFRELHDALAMIDVDLQLLYGKESKGSVPKTVELDVSWAHEIENGYLRVGQRELVWQSAWRRLEHLDLVILEQATRNLLNYALLLSRLLGRPARIALWGHGRNFQADRWSAPAEALKRWLAPKADWWFAYTELSAKAMAAQRVPLDRITVVDNTIDDGVLAAAGSEVSEATLADLRGRLNLERSSPVALYCGGLHRHKEIDFLLEAARAIRDLTPGFRMIVIGDGPEQAKVEAAAAKHEWIHFLGPVFGPQRAAYFRLAQALLMPAHVGLVVVDSFVMRTPMFATRLATHSPEVDYLQDGVNGVMTDFSISEYSQAVARYLADPMLQATLVRGCMASAERYTLKNMVSRFSSGIEACLARPRARGVR